MAMKSRKATYKEATMIIEVTQVIMVSEIMEPIKIIKSICAIKARQFSVATEVLDNRSYSVVEMM